MKNIFIGLICVFVAFSVTNCASDDHITQIESSLIYEVYPLTAISDPSVTGYARILKNENQSVTIELDLSGLITDQMHPDRKSTR